jgi:hypothetical protein
LPSNNVLAVSSGDFGDYTNGLTSPSVADGYYVMLPPLAPGSHTIHYTGAVNLSVANGDPFDFIFQQDITYNLTVVPTNGVFAGTTSLYGKTYADYSAAWWQWAFSLPTDHHPLFDTADASVGNTGLVWFLGGTYGFGGARTRTAVIPEGTALFFPILDNEDDNADCPAPDNFTEAELRATVQANQDAATNMSCTIDGVPVAGLGNGLTSAYRAQSPVFSYTMPGTNNLLNILGADCYSNTVPYTNGGAVADGVYLMLAPLPVGPHTVHFHGEIGSPSVFTDDITYNLTVTRNTYALTIGQQGGSATISWPQASNYALETTGSLSQPNWEPARLPVTAVDGQFQVALPVGSGTQFFRLHWQP